MKTLTSSVTLLSRPVPTILTACGLALFSVLSQAQTPTGTRSIKVGPGQSIQAAINSASPGDTVLVEAGTYREEIQLRSGVDVVGAGYGLTMLLGTGIEDVVSAVGVTNVSFSGFKVSNGGLSNYGIYISGGNPIIHDNWISRNYHGMGIYDGSSATISNNIVSGSGEFKFTYTRRFTDRPASPHRACQTHGIIVVGSTPLLVRNVVVDSGDVGLSFAGVECIGAQVINNIVADNQGKGIWCQDKADIIIRGNLIFGNRTGISAFFDARPKNSSNNVWKNVSSPYESKFGGLVILCPDDQPVNPFLSSTTEPVPALFRWRLSFYGDKTFRE